MTSLLQDLLQADLGKDIKQAIHFLKKLSPFKSRKPEDWILSALKIIFYATQNQQHSSQLSI